MVVHQYKNIKKIEKMVIARKEKKKEAKGEQEEVKQILNKTLFKDSCLKQPSHHFLGPFSHDTSLTKSTQIKD